MSCRTATSAQHPVLQVKWENAVIIFDEAHNVEGVCSDASSFDITGKNLADAMQETKRSVGACVGHHGEGQGVHRSGCAWKPLNAVNLGTQSVAMALRINPAVLAYQRCITAIVPLVVIALIKSM